MILKGNVRLTYFKMTLFSNGEVVVLKINQLDLNTNNSLVLNCLLDTLSTLMMLKLAEGKCFPALIIGRRKAPGSQYD